MIKKNFAGFFASLVATIMFVVAFGTVCLAADSQEISPELLYGRNKISEMPNAENLLKAYDAFYEGVSAKTATIDISEAGLCYEDAAMVWNIYNCDHAEQYWIPNGYYYSSYASGVVSSFLLEYLDGFDDVAFESEVEKIVSLAMTKTTDYEKSLVIHDALVKKITYASSTNAHNAYGALIDGVCVCEGYAEAYQYLLHRVGIQSYLVTGLGISSSGTENHEWNLVRLDGKYYFVDVTWDDPTGGDPSKPIFYPYFNVPTSVICENHIIDDPYNIIPVCTDADMMYKGYIVLSEFDADAVTAAFKGLVGKKYARIFYTGDDANEFYQSFKANASKVGGALGYNGFSFGATSCGRELYLYTVGNEIFGLTGYNISLNGDISLNYYFMFAPSITNDPESKVVFTLPDGKTYEVPVSSCVNTENGYKVTCPITSTQMSGTVSAVVFTSSISSSPFEYSVVEYAEAVIQGDYSADTKYLIKSMLNYGSYAQKYFGSGYFTDNTTPANFILPASERSVESAPDSISGFDRVLSGELPSGLNYTSSTLILTSKISIRHFFTVDAGNEIGDYTFISNGNTLTPVQSGNRYYVDVSDIVVADWDHPYAVNVGDWSVEYSAMGYIQTMLSKNTASAKLRELLKAMYLYNSAANEYVAMIA